MKHTSAIGTREDLMTLL